MKSDRLMAGYWLALFNKTLPEPAFSISSHDQIRSTLRTIANCLNDQGSDMETIFGGVFKEDEQEPNIAPASERDYIKFPDLELEANSWDKYFQKESKIEEKDFEENFAQINSVRIDINPCLSRLDNHDHSTKIYVIPWHVGNIDTNKLELFYRICDAVSEKIAVEVQKRYIDCIKDLVPSVKEDPLTHKLVTNVFFNEDINPVYDEIMRELESNNKVEHQLMARLWEPLLNFSKYLYKDEKIFDDYKPFIQKYYKKSVSPDEISGIFGIAGGPTNWVENEEVTHIIGVSPYPHDVATQVQIPIIENT